MVTRVLLPGAHARNGIFPYGGEGPSGRAPHSGRSGDVVELVEGDRERILAAYPETQFLDPGEGAAVRASVSNELAELRDENKRMRGDLEEAAAESVKINEGILEIAGRLAGEGAAITKDEAAEQLKSLVS